MSLSKESNLSQTCFKQKRSSIQEGIILDAKKDLIKTLTGVDDDISDETVKLTDFNNGVVELEINDYDLKNCFEQTTNKLI